jgi:transposase
VVESIRALRTVRRSAVKARTQTLNQLKALLVTAPAGLREHLRDLTTSALVLACSRLRPTSPLSDPVSATKQALRTLARRYRALTAEVRDADKELAVLVKAAAPNLLNAVGVGFRWQASCWSPPATTPTGCARKRRSRTCAEWLLCQPVPAEPTVTGSTEAVTVPRTTLCTPSSSADYAMTNAPGPTRSAGGRKACPREKS